MEAAPRILSAMERERYGRQLRLAEVGEAGQLRLKAAGVLVVGAGGLGVPAAAHLAAAGVGRVGIVEFDAISASNLPRQLLYEEAEVGRPKVAVLRERLQRQNPHVRVVPHPVAFGAANARALVGAYDLVLDASDNFPTRYLVSDACWLEGRPLVSASLHRFEGQLAVFAPGAGPCYRCLTPRPPARALSCAEGGVMGPLPGMLGALQAMEALKLLLGLGTPVVGRILWIDMLRMAMTELALPPDPACPLCGPDATIRDVVAIAPQDLQESDLVEDWELGPAELRDRMSRRASPHGALVLLELREPSGDRGETLPGARVVSPAELVSEIPALDPADDHVVACASGADSLEAVRLLRAAGISRAWSLAGGLAAWRRARPHGSALDPAGAPPLVHAGALPPGAPDAPAPPAAPRDPPLRRPPRGARLGHAGGGAGPRRDRRRPPPRRRRRLSGPRPPPGRGAGGRRAPLRAGRSRPGPRRGPRSHPPRERRLSPP